MTDIDRRRQRVEAQLTYEDAVANIAGIIRQLDAIGKRAGLIASRTRGIPIKVEDRTASESPLFALTKADFEDVTLSSILELTHALVEARKEAAGAEALARAIGCNV
jgi:hypothetical protein